MGHFSYVRIDHDGGEPWRPPESRLVLPGERPELEAALAVVNRDVAATLPGELPLVLMRTLAHTPPYAGALHAAEPADEGDWINVAMHDGRWHGNALTDPVEPGDMGDPLAVIAEAAQDTLVELLWRVWPVCPDHDLGLHLRSAPTPVWWCRGTPPARGTAPGRGAGPTRGTGRTRGAEPVRATRPTRAAGPDGRPHDVAPVGRLPPVSG